MNFALSHTITNEDVKDYKRLVDRENRTLTREKATKSLISSGVLDSDGKPRWPVQFTSQKGVHGKGKPVASSSKGKVLSKRKK